MDHEKIKRRITKGLASIKYEEPKNPCSRPIGARPITKERTKSNLLCCCNREIKKDDSYFIRFEPGEKPEIFCEFCITINT